MAQRPECMSQFLQAKFQSRLNCPERRVRNTGNFPVAQTVEESQLDRFALQRRKGSDAFLQKVSEIV
jgi:hypothetical protein